MRGRWKAIVPLHEVKMTTKKDAVEKKSHGIHSAGNARDFEIRHETELSPLLGGNMLDVHMKGTAAGAAVMITHNGACSVFTDRGRADGGEPDLLKHLSEIFNTFASVAASDDLKFRSRDGGGAAKMTVPPSMITMPVIERGSPITTKTSYYALA
jgi:hypothetical protein